jgi:hypothetical protein
LGCDHLLASEMQDETQRASAASSPDPLAVEGPDSRDMDVFDLLQDSVVGSGFGRTDNQNFVQISLELVIQFDFVFADVPASQNRARHATTKVVDLL